MVGDAHQEGGSQGLRRLLSLSRPPTAVACFNDLTAIGVLREAKTAGICVPDDLSVMGFDDVPMTEYVDPPLSTVRQDTYGLGHAGADHAAGLVAGREPFRGARHPADRVGGAGVHCGVFDRIITAREVREKTRQTGLSVFERIRINRSKHTRRKTMQRSISRRKFLKVGTAALASLATPAFLAGCGSTPAPTSPPATAPQPPYPHPRRQPRRSPLACGLAISGNR